MITNSTLILLVITNSPPKLGNYRHLMCYFSMISILLAIFDFLVQAYIVSDASFIIVMDLENSVFENHPTIAHVVLGCVTALFEAAIFVISISFVFRYFALQR
ncbi:hypothetical protein GCK72_013202 [Caenorhabditis remanei]|nr:hypothetical protein GCK72_013202 [Caenorhabditis remanei]KAF1756748.1 hypothetical protein GCK72_013202 [Caenorhabditis remanei]